MISFILFITIWLLSATATAGTAVAYFDGKYPDDDDFRETLSIGILFGLVFGPIGTFMSAFLSGFWQYGWRLWPKT
jgi:hypothetical protein